MLSTQIHTAPNVFLIPVPFKNHKLESTNCYVIRDGGDVLLVDTGAYSEKSRAFFEEALAELGVDLGQAGAFLTHLHMDHAGMIDPCVPAHSPIYLNERDYRQAKPVPPRLWLEDLEEALVHEGLNAQEAHELIERRRSRVGIFTGEHNLVFTADGDAITVGEYTFRVVDTAGHTAGHQALYEPTSGIIFTGDHILYTLSPGIGLFLPEGDSVQTYIKNLLKVRDLQPTCVFHSHGPQRSDFVERIDWLIDHNRQRAAEVRGIVAAQPGLSGFDVTKRMNFNVPFDCWEDISRVQRLSLLEIGSAFLRHLAATGAIEVREDEAGIRRYYPAD